MGNYLPSSTGEPEAVGEEKTKTKKEVALEKEEAEKREDGVQGKHHIPWELCCVSSQNRP